MADSTVNDISKMKVVDLRKELKSRGIAHTGDKAELVARLKTAMAQEEQGDINLDSDEIDSDGVLEDEDDKINSEIVLDESAVELALADQPSPPKEEAKPTRTLKRKIFSSEAKSDKPSENKNGSAKKIILHRPPSITSKIEDNKDSNTQAQETKPAESKLVESTKVKITAAIDPKSRLEQRAKRFGLPINLSEQARKEARKQRFNTTNTTSSMTSSGKNDSTLPENLEKLKKRAERFGQSVSKIMSDIEQKELLEKRAAKFSVK